MGVMRFSLARLSSVPQSPQSSSSAKVLPGLSSCTIWKFPLHRPRFVRSQASHNDSSDEPSRRSATVLRAKAYECLQQDHKLLRNKLRWSDRDDGSFSQFICVSKFSEGSSLCDASLEALYSTRLAWWLSSKFAAVRLVFLYSSGSCGSSLLMFCQIKTPSAGPHQSTQTHPTSDVS